MSIVVVYKIFTDKKLNLNYDNYKTCTICLKRYKDQMIKVGSNEIPSCFKKNKYLDLYVSHFGNVTYIGFTEESINKIDIFN